MENSTKNSMMMPAALVIAAGLIAAAIIFKGGTTAPTVATVPTQAQQPTAIAVDITKIKTDGEPFIGKIDAPVTVALWADYQCPFCKRFDQDAVKQLMTDYVNTGKVKLVFKDFSFLGADSDTAGLAARAVWEAAPDKFAQWHEAMSGKQDAENGRWANKDDILALTKSLGIDATKVAQLMTDTATEYQKLMDADKAEGSANGINGTPGTIIGKQLLSGAQPYSAVKQLVEAELQKK